jgi:hypothetical protein
MASTKSKTKSKGGWGYYKRLKHPMKVVVVFISEEAHARLKRKAFLEERTLQKVARRLIEEGVKNVLLAGKGKKED